MDDDFTDLVSRLEWGSKLDLTAEQRTKVKPLCCKIAGITAQEGAIPSWRLREEAEAKRAAIARAETAEQRVKELEAVLKNQRQEWVFRRKGNSAQAIKAVGDR